MRNRLFSPASFRLPLVCLILSIAGCGGAGNERMDAMESSINELRVQEVRLALLENKVDALNTDVSSVKDAIAVWNAAGPQGKKGGRAASLPAGRATPVAAPAVKSAAAGDGAYEKALARFQAGKTDSAREMFSAFLKDNPSSPLAPNAGYWLGECYFSLKQYDTAIITFKDVVAKYPKHDKAAASMLKAGYAYARLGDAANARFYLETLIQDFPKSDPAKLARKRLSSL